VYLYLSLWAQWSASHQFVLYFVDKLKKMGGLFSKKKNNNRVNHHDKAVLDLKVQRDKLKQYQKKCEDVLAKETSLARSLLKEGKKKLALLALKKKKYQEQLLQKTETQLTNIQQMIDSVEFAQIEQKVFQGLKEGNEVLKEIHAQMSIDEIDKLMEDTQEAIAYQQEVEDGLYGKLTTEDEDDVMEQLAELEKEAGNKLLEALPETPKEKLPKVEVPVEDEELPQQQPVKQKKKSEKTAVLA